MKPEEHIRLDLALCQQCGGRCCQGSPGVWRDPQRFMQIFFSGQCLTLEQLRPQLPGIGVVLWEKDGVPVPAPLSLGTGCSMWAENGCRLLVADRPCQCLALIPVAATLEQETGCCCRLPDLFSRERVRQNWRAYWQSLPGS